jgi:hypothetical protein
MSETESEARYQRMVRATEDLYHRSLLAALELTGGTRSWSDEEIVPGRVHCFGQIVGKVSASK